MIKQHHGFTVASRGIKVVIKHQEDVHIIRNRRLRNKRTKYHKACQVAGCSSKSVNTSDTFKQDLTLPTHRTKHSRQFSERGDVYSNREVTGGVQLRKWNCSSPLAANDTSHRPGGRGER